jgi:long-subunit fatty acid transport protein
MRKLLSALSFLSLLAAGVTPALAQTGQTAQIPLQFDFLNPGARSLGMGSAFVAVADDATTAFTNPAGLTQLVLPEVSLEMRYRSLDTTYLAGGRLSGNVTNNGVDTINGPVYGISPDSTFRPYFFSFVFPIKRVSLAAYRHELVLQENEFMSNGPFLQDFFGNVTVNNARMLGLAGERKITVDNYGGTAAYRVSDQLSLGVGLNVYKFDLEADFGSLNFPDGQFAPADPGTRGLSSTTTQDGSDTQLGVNAGALITLHPKVRAGLVYRQGVNFNYSTTAAVPGRPTNVFGADFRSPSVTQVGVRILPSDAWSFAADYSRLQYSRLASDFITLQVDPDFVDRVSIPDGNEFHLGGEYTFVNVSWRPSIRGGLWYDPKHAVQYAADGSNDPENVKLNAIFPGGESLWHYCFGIGMPVSRLLEFNVGADFSEERNYVSASVVVRFRK